MRIKIFVVSLFCVFLICKGGDSQMTLINAMPLPGEFLTQTGDRWEIHYQRHFTGSSLPAWAGELKLNPKAWKSHPRHPHICGYNGDITVRLQLPGNLNEVKIEAVCANYADRKQRAVQLAYSLDGVEFIPAAKARYGTGEVKASAMRRLEGQAGSEIWLRFSRILEKGDSVGLHSYVVFKSIALSLSGTSSAAAASLGAEAAPSQVDDSKNIQLRDCVIVIPDQPLHIPRRYSTDNLVRPLSDELNQRVAAERLQMLIKRACGQDCAIVKASEKPENKKCIYVGYGEHLRDVITAPNRVEGVKIAEIGGELYILGEIAPAGTNNRPAAVDRGIMHAVEIFAEEVMGYRFLISTINDEAMFALGTVIPKATCLSVPRGLLLEDAPGFQHRLISAVPSPLIGLRACSSINFSCNHSYGMAAWAREYAEKYPQMFIPKAGGKTQNDEDAARNAQVDLSFLDYTEPLVLEKRLEHLEAWFERREKAEFFAGRTPSDTYIIEEPPDMSAPSFRYNARSEALWNPNCGTWGDFSAIWFDYLRRLGAEVKKRWPNMRIAALSYNRHYQPPEFEMPDNIDVALCLMRSSAQCKEPYVFQKNLQQVEKWYNKLGRDRNRLSLWEYGCWPDCFLAVPLNYAHSMQKWLREIKPMVSGVFIEHYGPIEQNFLMRHLWMRLLWNPELDVDQEIDDVCARFFGAGGDSMARFHKLLMQRYEMQWQNPRLIWDQYHVRPQQYYGQSFTPEVVLTLAAMLDQACREAGLERRIDTIIKNGNAIYFFNDAENKLPLRISLIAAAEPVTNPRIAWEGGELGWQGVLLPEQKLVIEGDGEATLIEADQSSSTCTLKRQGAALSNTEPVSLHFWHQGEPDIDFQVRVELAGQDGKAQAAKSIYAHRLDWVRKSYQCFRGDRMSSASGYDGFFVDAAQAHQHLGKVPQYEVAGFAFSSQEADKIDWLKLPAAALLRGKANSSQPHLIMGYPADLACTFRVAKCSDALLLRFEAEGTPLAEEKLTVSIAEKTYELEPAGTADTQKQLWRLSSTDCGWQATVHIPLQELKLEPNVPKTLNMQVSRSRGTQHYVWSPPLAMWGDREQGDGILQIK